MQIDSSFLKWNRCKKTDYHDSATSLTTLHIESGVETLENIVQHVGATINLTHD